MSTKNADPVVVARLPKSLVKLVDAAARRNCRTRSAEIRARLGESFAGAKVAGKATAVA